jgi:hypothetical protein
MGLRMMLDMNSKCWRAMHLASALVMPFLVLALLGCQRAKEETAPIGPENDVESINKALGKATSGQALTNLKVGQFVKYSILRRIENNDVVNNLGDVTVEVIALDEKTSPVQNRYFLKITKHLRNSSNGFDEVISQDEIWVSKPGTSSILSTYPRSHILTKAVANAYVTTDNSKPEKVTFHNLRESDEVLPIPSAVQKDADCGGLSPCSIPIRLVQFDLVYWYEGGKKQKINLNFGFSSVTPFLPFGDGFDLWNGMLVMDCRSTFVPVEDRTVFVRDCQSLEDFQR